jgi:TonB family protein
MQRAVMASLAVHVVLVTALVLAPRPDARIDNRPIMTISLGGAPGPRAGGMTPMGGRPIAPAAEPTRKAPPTPAPAKTPEMVEPTKTAPPVAKTPVKTAPDEARGRRVVTGPEPQAGNTPVDTGAKGIGFGLTTGGGGTGGYLDIQNFCCPEYLGTMLQLIQRNWNSRQQVPGETLVKYTIQRDGRLTDIELEKSSGYAALDLTAQRALALTRQLPPLPAQFTEPTLTVHLVFRYER